MVRAMRRNSRAVHHLFRLRWLLAAFMLTCVVGAVYAGVRVNASSVRSTGVTATGVRTTATLEATFTGTVNGVKTYGVPVPVSSSTLGSLARGAMRRALPAYTWYQVAKGLIDGAGWAIGELQDQVIVPGVPQEPLGESSWCFYVNGQPSRCASAPGMLTATAHLVNPDAYAQPCSATYMADFDRAFYQCVRKADGATVTVNSDLRVVRPPAGWPAEWNANPGSEAVPVSDYDLGQLLKQSPQVVNAILIDPETGAPIRTQELVDAMNDLRRQLEAANGFDPGPDVLPNDDPAKPEIRESEWPGFCDWATKACEFIDWVKEDAPAEEKPEVPWEEEKPADVTQSWSSGLGGGSCPSPVTFTVSLAGQSATPEFSFDGLCQFATIMRPVIIALAAIIAGFIIAGVRGSKDA